MTVIITIPIALVDCFKTFDSDEDGYIGIDELPEALSFAGVHLTDEDISDVLRLFDNKGKAPVSPEVRSLCLRALKTCTSARNYRSVKLRLKFLTCTLSLGFSLLHVIQEPCI